MVGMNYRKRGSVEELAIGTEKQEGREYWVVRARKELDDGREVEKVRVRIT